jgi:riboflavin synthase
MRVSSRLSGHLVTGHVDAVGTIRERLQDGSDLRFMIEAPRDVLRLCVLKGSITVDGVSLTINEVMGQAFRVSIIPQTAKLTTLGLKRGDDPVNLESDLIGKYIDRLLQDQGSSTRSEIKIDRDYLAKRGLL